MPTFVPCGRPPANLRTKRQSVTLEFLVIQMEIDEGKFYESSLEEDWEVLMPREISDPDDKKPSDSVDDWTDKVAEGVDCTTVSLTDSLVISAEVVIGVRRQNVLAIDSTRSALYLRSQFKYGRTTSTSCFSSDGVSPNPEASCSDVKRLSPAWG